MRRFRMAVLCLTLGMLQLPLLMAQNKPTVAPDAPVPPQILVAKKVFIANAGGDQMTPDDPSFSGGPDRAYNQFYAAIKSWGRFSIVGSLLTRIFCWKYDRRFKPVRWAVKPAPSLLRCFDWTFATRKRTRCCGASTFISSLAWVRGTATGLSIR